MKLTITTTPEQDEALAAENLRSNPKGDTDVQVYTESIISGFLDEKVKAFQSAKVDATKSKLDRIADTLTDDQISRINAIAQEAATAKGITFGGKT